MKLFCASKKGSWTDSIYIFFFFIFIVFLALIFLLIMRGLNDGFNNSDIAQEGKDLITDVTNDIRSRADNTIILFFFILVIGSWISSYFLDNQPIFFVLFFILSFVSFFILLPIANIAYNLEYDLAFVNEIQYLPKTFFIVNHFASFLAFYLITTGVILYGKNKYNTYKSNGFQ